jgi:hypothetical protein
MKRDSNTRRRWLGAFSLLGALGMLVAGETVLKHRLDGLGFLAYWLICFALTGLTMLIAIRDAQAQLRQTRQEHLQLFETAVQGIKTKAETKGLKDQTSEKTSTVVTNEPGKKD